MTWFYNLKIAKKLLIAFTIVAAITSILGFISIANLENTDKQYSNLYEQYGEALGDIANITQSLQLVRINLRDAVIYKGSNDRQKYVQKIKELDEKINSDMAKYEKSINTSQERQDYDHLAQVIKEFQPVRDQIVNLAVTNQEDKAIVMMRRPDVVKLANSIEASINKILEKNILVGHQLVNTYNANSQKTISLMILLVIFAVLMAFVLGMFISRTISNPLEKIVAVADELAAGNVEVHLQSTTKDEIGELASSFEKMVNVIRNVVKEQEKLAKAAAEGRLEVRGNTDNFEGSYRDIISGINNTLDSVVEPIREAAVVLDEMAQGNLQVSMKGNYKGDFATIKVALNGTIGALVNYISEISKVLNDMADGNLNVGITTEYKGDFVEIKNSLNQIIDSFNRILSEINTAAQQVASGAMQVSNSSQHLSQGSNEQASSIEELTASMEEIAAQTQQNAQNANQANDYAVTAKTDAVKGNEQMQEMVKAMLDINNASSNISKIIKVIDEIAFQTNILALNAAVEAARAGQHGKGFAVVAEEVRNLAARSADAAKETTVLIEGTIKKVESGMKIADETANALMKIVEGVTHAATLVGEIALASNEQALGITQVNQGITQVSQVTQTNSANSEESAAASEELSSHAELLREMVNKFKIKQEGISSEYLSEINPAVLRMLEGMAEKKKVAANINQASSEAAAYIMKNSLSDQEFGKY